MQGEETYMVLIGAVNGGGRVLDGLDTARFRVDVERERDGTRVCPIGEVDVATIGRLREQVAELIAAGVGRLILDLRQATFLDSTGLRLAVEIDRSAAANGTEFAIYAGPPAVQRVFAVTGLGERLPFAEPPRP